MILLLPVALFFLASFLLTRRWYIRAASVPGLFLGAIVQPLLTAVLFFTGMDLIGQARTGAPSVGFASIFLLATLFCGLIATPMALLSCIDPLKRIRARKRGHFEAAQDNGFVVLMMAGIISLACAMLAIVTVYQLFELND